MKLIPVVCSPSGSQIATYLYCGARLQAAHCTQLDGNKYELKAAANESKSKPNVGKGIASPSLVPGAEERGKGVPGVYCLHMWSILGTPGHLRYTNFCESAVFSCVEDAYYQPRSK